MNSNIPLSDRSVFIAIRRSNLPRYSSFYPRCVLLKTALRDSIHRGVSCSGDRWRTMEPRLKTVSHTHEHIRHRRAMVPSPMMLLGVHAECRCKNAPATNFTGAFHRDKPFDLLADNRSYRGILSRVST